MQRTCRRWDDDSGVSYPVQQSGNLHLAGRLLENKVDLGVTLGKGSHERGEDVVIGNADERQFQPSDFTAK